MPKDNYINVRVTPELKKELNDFRKYSMVAESTLCYLLIKKGLSTMPAKGTKAYSQWWQSLVE